MNHLKTFKSYFAGSYRIRILLGALIALVISDGLITKFLMTHGLGLEWNPFLQSWVVGYGLGLMKAKFPGDIEAIGHSGDSANFHAFVFYLPDQGITISGMANFPDGIACFSQLIPLALDILVK